MSPRDEDASRAVVGGSGVSGGGGGGEEEGESAHDESCRPVVLKDR